MASLNTPSSPSSFESDPQNPQAKLIILDEKRRQFQKVLSPEQRFISASALLQGLDADLVRILASHYAFSGEFPDSRLIAHANFSQSCNGPGSDPVALAA